MNTQKTIIWFLGLWASFIFVVVVWRFCVKIGVGVPPPSSRKILGGEFFMEYYPQYFFRTGDLLFFRGDSLVEKTIQTYTRSRYNHVALVVVEGESVLLWEADVGENHKEGTRMIPLREKLDKWRGHKEVAIRPIRKSINLERVLAFARRRLDHDFDKSMMRYVCGSWWPRDPKKYFCSELVADTLISTNTIPPIKPPSSFCPGDLLSFPFDSYFSRHTIIRY